MTCKDLRYVKNNAFLSLKNGYIEEVSGNKYLTLVLANESKETPKKYEELWNKIRDLLDQ